MNPIVEVNVHESEIGKLNGVIIHTPGEEVENMTPENAERAFYTVILSIFRLPGKNTNKFREFYPN